MVVDIIAELAEYNVAVDVYDPQTNPDEVEHECAIRTIHAPETNTYDGVIRAVAHREFRERGGHSCMGQNKTRAV